jgi:hypothetical protein
VNFDKIAGNNKKTPKMGEIVKKVVGFERKPP